MKQSLSKPGYPYDNAVCESFFSHLKKEEVNRSEYESIAHFASCLATYIHFSLKR
ncbi:MAG: integrase core domain-containing protein [Clostridia bacterium]|nr:integrase core domain-containing protein [Clostridia bacterium]